jgi:predicted DNA-binding WGR domain protein
MLYEASELYKEGTDHSSFYRIIHYGGTLLVRYGRSGTKGRRRVEYHTPHDAFRRFHTLVNAKADHATALYDHQPFTHGLEPQPDALEQYMLQRWHELSPVPPPNSLHEEGVQWGVMEHALADSKADQFYRFVLTDASLVPHAIDHARDLVLIPVYTAPRYDIQAWLGPVLPEHTSDVAATVLSLYYPGHPRPKEVFSACQAIASTT